MKAIRGLRQGAYELHWLADPEWTECGRQVKHFDQPDQLDLAQLSPHPEACPACEAILEGFHKRPAHLPSAAVHYLRPAPGRLFTEGPLTRGPQARRQGRRLD